MKRERDYRGLTHYGNWTLLSDESKKQNKGKILTLFPIFKVSSFSFIALFHILGDRAEPSGEPLWLKCTGFSGRCFSL